MAMKKSGKTKHIKGSLRTLLFEVNKKGAIENSFHLQNKDKYHDWKGHDTKLVTICLKGKGWKPTIDIQTFI